MAVPGGAGPSYPGGYTPRPQIRFDAIGEAWRLFQQQVGTWVVTALVYIIILAVVQTVVSAIFGAPSRGLQHAGSGAAAIAMLPVAMGSSLIGMLINMAVGVFFQGGMFRMAIKQIRGEAIAMGDLFSVTDVFPQLLVGSLLTTLAVIAGMFACCIGAFFVASILIFVIPLIVDKGVSGVEAIGMSWNALKGDFLMAFLFVLVLGLLLTFGTLVTCGLGALVLVPLYHLAIGILYRDYFMGPMTSQPPYTPPPTVPPPPPAP